MAEYSEYKDSGQQWLGIVPSHWRVDSMKHCFNVISIKGRPDLPQLCSTQKYGVIPQSLYENRVVSALKGLDTLKVVSVGDFVISLRSFQGGIEYAYYDGIISPAYTILRPRESDNSGYYRYLLKSQLFITLLQSMVTGIREGQNIDYDKLKYEYIPIPPIEEQEAIVAYLDKVTADIGKAIAAKERIIASLEERRKIIITHAVTHGINPEVPMKASGIDWLGEIPAHWDCTKLKNFIRIKSGDSISNSDLSENGQYVVYGGGEPLGRYDRFNVSCGAIIVGRVGARCGCVTPIHQDVWATDNALVITPDGISMEYLSYILIAADLNKLSSTNAQPLLTGTKVKNTFFALPPIKEQQSILQYIESQIIKIDSAVAHQKRLIELLRERKNIIINETVTGKVKVI